MRQVQRRCDSADGFPSTVVDAALASALQLGNVTKGGTAMNPLWLAPLLWAIVEVAAVVLLSRDWGRRPDSPPVDGLRRAA
jgi:hypothetical protein